MDRRVEKKLRLSDKEFKRNEPELLQNAYRTCLELAVEHGFRSIAFPSISTGIYGFPIDRAAPLAIQTVIDFLNAPRGNLELVHFCLFSDADLEVYKRALDYPP